jgi:hypothetical protein
MISLPAVIFKGSGFYHTDNRKESSGNGRSSTPSESSSEASTTSSDHGHSHGSGGHSHDSSTAGSPKVEAAAAEP